MNLTLDYDDQSLHWHSLFQPSESFQKISCCESASMSNVVSTRHSTLHSFIGPKVWRFYGVELSAEL